MNKTFELNKLYILESEETGLPYLSRQKECFMFPRIQDAEAEAQKIPGTSVSPPKLQNVKAISRACFMAGADKIVVKAGNQKEELVLRETDMELSFYNHSLASTITLLKQIKETEYLYQLGSCNYLVPAKVTSDGESVTISYAVARHSIQEDMISYLAFSTLSEFSAWQAKAGKEWQPILMHYKKLRRLCGTDGFIINPEGGRLVIGKSMIKKIDKKLAQAK